jgi:predicted phage tail protein
VGVVELLTEFTTGYWWGSWNCLPSSPRIIGGDRGTVYRIHHGLLVGVVELFTEFTTGYWWGPWNCLSSSPRGIGGGRGTVYKVHLGLLVVVVELFTVFNTGYWWGSWLLVGVVLLDLSFFVLCFQILIIPLVSSNSSYSLS